MSKSPTVDSRILFSAEQIENRVSSLAKLISADYQGRTIDVICLINSATMFCSDLVRKITRPSRLHFLCFSSFSPGNKTGEVRVTLDVSEPLHGKDVLIVEGIVVSGRTPRYLLDVVGQRQPASLALCALGVKKDQLCAELPLKYVGFELGSEIAVGYGVGSANYRCLPYLTAQKPVNE